MKIIKAAGLITASVIAFSSLSSITAGAVTFTEDDKGVKTWTFEVNEKYPDGVTVEDNGDACFANEVTYYVKDGWSTEQPATENASDYLKLSVNNSVTIESVANNALQLKGSNSHGGTSELTWTVPEDGTISVTSVNGLDMAVNDNEAFTIEWKD